MRDLSNGLAILVQSAWMRLRDRQEGQTMVEYGLLIAGIALICIAAIIILGPAIRDLFSETASSVNTPLGPPATP